MSGIVSGMGGDYPDVTSGRPTLSPQGEMGSTEPLIVTIIKLMFPFILSVFLPGLGQVLLSRYLKGLFILFSIIILLDLYLVIIPFLFPTLHALRSTLYILSVCIYLYNFWDIFNIVYYRKRKSLQERKKFLLKQGVKYYLKNDLYAARQELKRALKLDKDDVDMIYYLGRIEKSLGDTRQEKLLLNKLSLLDFDKKWI
jgi:hypothetical protein